MNCFCVSFIFIESHEGIGVVRVIVYQRKGNWHKDRLLVKNRSTMDFYDLCYVYTWLIFHLHVTARITQLFSKKKKRKKEQYVRSVVFCKYQSCVVQSLYHSISIKNACKSNLFITYTYTCITFGMYVSYLIGYLHLNSRCY